MTVIPFAPSPAEPAGQWPAPSPLPSTLPQVPDFEPHMLPDELRPWALDIADRMQVPLDFVAIPAMVAAGSLIGSKVGIRPESRTDWTEVANVWGCIVGPPGALKSPAVAEALAPLRRLEHQAALRNEAASATYVRDHALHKLRRETAEQQAKKELKDGEVGLARDILAQLDEPDEPRMERHLTSDATAEKLGEICAANPKGLLVHRDELLTLFADLDREEKAAARGFFLTGWGGKDGYTFDRIGRGTVRIDRVNLSVLGTTQPNRLPRYMRESFQHHDDGMVQRVQLLCWPDFAKEWRQRDEYPDAVAKTNAFACYARLADLIPGSVGCERDAFDDGAGIPFLRFETGALELFNHWRATLENRLRGDDLAPQFQAHLSKFRGLVPRVALIHHLASGGRGEVMLTSLRVALMWAEYLEQHAARAYASMTTANTDVATAILRRIKKGDLRDSFTERDIYRQGWSGLGDRERVVAGLRLLEEFDWLASERIATGGRPSLVWYANPAIQGAAGTSS